MMLDLLRRGTRLVWRALRRFFSSRAVRKFFSTPTSATGFFLVFAFAIIALLAPVLAPPRPGSNAYMIPRDSYLNEPQPPSKEHPLGTTSGQYDIWYGLVWGTRTAFRIGIVVTFGSALIGIFIGTLAAFYSRVFGEISMRIVDIFMTMPFLIAAMVMTTVLGTGIDNVMVALIAFGWMTYARLARGDVMTVKNLDYVQAARAVGASDWRIITRHLLPNAIFPLFVMATMDIGSMVLAAAGLSFLGLGAELGYADWGQMVSFARNWMSGTVGSPLVFWYTIIFPGLTIVLFGLGWNLMGDGVRDIFDPRMRGSK